MISILSTTASTIQSASLTTSKLSLIFPTLIFSICDLSNNNGGFDLNIGDGIVRARYRDSRTEEKLMNPGEVYEFEVRLYPTSNVFKKGHRIRVDIAGSNFPRFDVNPNTGEPLNENRRKMKAINTIYHDKSRPSHILLPVIPSGS